MFPCRLAWPERDGSRHAEEQWCVSVQRWWPLAVEQQREAMPITGVGGEFPGLDVGALVFADGLFVGRVEEVVAEQYRVGEVGAQRRGQIESADALPANLFSRAVSKSST